MLNLCKTKGDLLGIVNQLRERRLGQTPLQKLGWYYRYWESQNLQKGISITYTEDSDWDTQISQDPLFNKKLKQEQLKKATETIKNENILLEGGIDMNLGMFLDEQNEQE